MLNLTVFEMKTTLQLIFLFSSWPLLAKAQLVVRVSPPKVVGQRAVVKLQMKNDLPAKVQSARAVCFLLDDNGKMAGQSTKWVIGKNEAGLEPKAETTFNFVITSPQPLTTTNLTAQVSFSRVVLAGDKLANPYNDVIINQSEHPQSNGNGLHP